jgi:hypothetical protein
MQAAIAGFVALATNLVKLVELWQQAIEVL